MPGEARGAGIKYKWRGLPVEGKDINFGRQRERSGSYSVERIFFRVWEKESWQYLGFRGKLKFQDYGLGKPLGECVETNWLHSVSRLQIVLLTPCQLNAVCRKGMAWLHRAWGGETV